MNSVKDLDVFKLAHQLAFKTYSATKTFPKEETFSLVEQMRRAAASVGMNLMEGPMRLGSKEYRQFVGIARGSVARSGPRSRYFRPTIHVFSPIHDHVLFPTHEHDHVPTITFLLSFILSPLSFS
jgi:hypothetical protein